MQLIACQLDMKWEDKPANYDKVRAVLSNVDVKPGALIVLPEMFATGFSMNVDAVAEGDERPSEVFAKEITASHQACVIAGVVNRNANGQGLNQSVAFAPNGDELVRYDKMQPFTLGQEDCHYAAGNVPKVFRWQDHTVSSFVCYDLRFPEVFRMNMREHRPHVITVIASWPATRVEHWVTLLKARAIENQAYVVGVNRCGSDPTLDYSGRSLIVDPMGIVLADAEDAECAISADTDFDAMTTYRQKLPFLNDMRCEIKIRDEI